MRSNKASNKTTAEPTVLSRRSFIHKIGLTSLGCALLLMPWTLSAWNSGQGNGSRLETIQERKTMQLAQQSTPPDRPIPPIDATAPAATETATFALG